jgi:cell division inhibitor SulA
MNTAPQLHHLNAQDHRKRRRSVQTLSSGIAALDALLPAGGWPRHGLVEIGVSGVYTDPMDVLLPALAGLSREGRWLAMVTPPHYARARVNTDPRVDTSSVLQINPHKGRSGLWTLESLMRAGHCRVVLAWPSCRTELMEMRLARAATLGRSLGVLFRHGEPRAGTTGCAVRLSVERSTNGLAVVLVDNDGNRVAGIDLPQHGSTRRA